MPGTTDATADEASISVPHPKILSGQPSLQASKLSSAQKQQIRGSVHADLSMDTNMCDNFWHSQATPLMSHTHNIQQAKQTQISVGDLKRDKEIHK